MKGKKRNSLTTHIPLTPRNSSALPLTQNIHLQLLYDSQQKQFIMHGRSNDIYETTLLLTSYATNEWPYLADGPWCFSVEA